MARPTERTEWGKEALHRLLGSAARARVLSCLLLPGATPTHIRELARSCGLHYSAVRREIKLLESLGLVEAEQVGTSKRYHLVAGAPLLAPLRDLVREAVGVVPLLKAAVDTDGVEISFIYGSVAAGEDRPGSDVDVMIVGDADDAKLSEALDEVTRQTGREITPVGYRPEEFRQALREGNSFLTSVLRKPKIMLKGDEDALQRLGA
jgi:DNA-binding transcriptional ArsR family regulator